MPKKKVVELLKVQNALHDEIVIDSEGRALTDQTVLCMHGSDTVVAINPGDAMIDDELDAELLTYALRQPEIYNILLRTFLGGGSKQQAMVKQIAIGTHGATVERITAAFARIAGRTDGSGQ